MRKMVPVLVLLLAPALLADTKATLRAQTQELFDAVTNGDAKVWDRLLDADAIITIEDGSVNRKAEMVKSIRPLPKDVSGNLALLEFTVIEKGNVAIANYLIDEDETYHGHKLHCQYRVTDTWTKKNDAWRLLASQVHAVRSDPPSMQLADAQLEAYVGRYSLAPDLMLEIRRGANGLESKRGARDWQPMLAEAPDVLFNPGAPRYRYIVQRDAEGHVTGITERREAWDLPWKRES